MSRSQQLFSAAKKRIPGGVNSPVRAFQSVGGTPLFFKKAKGAYLFDEDNNTYVDYVGAFGPALLGHGNAQLLTALHEQIEQGIGYGSPSALEIDMANLIYQYMPSMQMIRMVNSGTEATMSAIRLARAFTKRDTIIKFEGCYHGHFDSLLVKAGSSALLGEPTSPGVPKCLAKLTLSLQYNNIAMLEETFKSYGNDVAAIIVEPVAGNMNCVLPKPDFLPALRRLCDQYGSLLIFDEVMTGFRVHLGGAQAQYKVRPDLTTLGKIIGGGLPVGAFGGRADIMSLIAPMGPVYQAGTMSGNPLTMAAGCNLLKQLTPAIYQQLNQQGQLLCEGLQYLATAAGIPFTTNQIGGMFGFFFSNKKITTFDRAMSCHNPLFKVFFHAMLENGIYFAPSPFEAGFLSICHSKPIIEKTLEVAEKAFTKVQDTYRKSKPF